MAVTLPVEAINTSVASYTGVGTVAHLLVSGRSRLVADNIEYDGPLASAAANIAAILTHAGKVAQLAGLLTALRARGLAL